MQTSQHWNPDNTQITVCIGFADSTPEAPQLSSAHHCGCVKCNIELLLLMIGLKDRLDCHTTARSDLVFRSRVLAT